MLEFHTRDRLAGRWAASLHAGHCERGLECSAALRCRDGDGAEAPGPSHASLCSHELLTSCCTDLWFHSDPSTESHLTLGLLVLSSWTWFHPCGEAAAPAGPPGILTDAQ